MNVPFLHRDVPAVVRAAQLVGITGAAFLAGNNFSMSAHSVPAVLQAPAPLAAKQWKKVYDLGKQTVPPMTIVVSAIFGYLAFRERNTSTLALGLYAGAAFLPPSIIPYTIAVMGPTNKKLIQKAESAAATTTEDAAAEAGVTKEDTVHVLIDRWASLNLVRAILLFSSAALGAWATLSPIEVLGLDRV